MVSSTLAPVFFARVTAKIRQTTIMPIPATAKIMVKRTALALAKSVTSSSVFPISTTLFNAGVHSLIIASVASAILPPLISSIME